MPKVRRAPPLPHIVVVDTNILWDKDKKLPASPAFDAFWKKNSPLIPMTLNVPDVVFGELQFQQTTSALKALASINENFSELNGITCASYKHKCNESVIKEQVRAKLEKWLKGHSGVLIPTPVASVDWSAVVKAAVWRQPPFTFDPKDQKNEKGFRDAVILETLADTCARTSIGKTVIFVCSDYLLRTTAECRLKASKKLLAFESLADFEAYINLTQQQLTNAFVKSIQNHARTKFYTKGDQNCVYLKYDLWKKIEADFSSDLAFQNPSPNMLTLLRQSSSPDPAVSKLSQHLIWVRSTQFSKLDGMREFHWISHVDVVLRFVVEVQPGSLASATPPIQRLQVVGFDVMWKANVKTDGRFHDIELEVIEKKESQVLDATEDNLKQWRMA